MRSAETSGVTAKGNAVPKDRMQRATVRLAAIAGRAARLVEDISPVTLAVAVTALVAAILFIAYDIIRSFDEARPFGPLASPADHGEIWGAIVQRGVLCVMLACIAAALAYRRRNGEVQSRAERRRLRELVATIPFGVALWTREGQLIVCNDHYVERLHREGPEVGPGRSYQEAVKRLTRGGYVRLVNEGDNNRILELHREDGSCLLIDERPLASSGFVTLVTDITERKRTDLLLNAIQEEQRQLARRYHEEKLKAEAASRAKTSFLAHLSHDIRTPLNHIIGFADLIRHQTYGPLGDARYVGYVDMIKASGDKLLSSFASILELAEFESGTRPLREEQLGIDDLVVAVTRRFSAQAGRAGLALGIGAPCHAQLFADRFCLERMLGNLVENAIRFTPSGGKVTLAAYAANDGVVLEVSDSGIGMTDEQLARLSQPFVFGDAAFTREHQGAGLGIAIARAIAELSGGRLAIDSRPALGTTVAISLPLHHERSLTPARAA
jgi:two-component system cell cycle sensor histidine kinase PleC